jgi:hypothetical protein
MSTINRSNMYFSTYALLNSKSFTKTSIESFTYTSFTMRHRFRILWMSFFRRWKRWNVFWTTTQSTCNLHHSLWSNSIRFMQHVVINQLIELFNATHMQFCLSQNIVIWKAKNLINTIDLMFMINRLQICVINCENWFDLI